MRHAPRKNMSLAISFVGVALLGALLLAWPYLTSAKGAPAPTTIASTRTAISATNIPAPFCPGSPHCDVWKAGAVTMTVTAYPGPRDEARGGQTLAYLRKSFGGDEGDLTDPFFGTLHHISLKAWANADPDNTYIVVKFTVAAPRPQP